MKKRGFQLSLQMIIIVILALAFLVVGLGFIQKLKPPEIEVPHTCDIYPPTANNPVCIDSNIELKRGQTANVETAFFNDEDADIDASLLPEISCSANVDGNVLDLSTTATGNSLPVGSYEDYLVIIKIPKNAPRGSYPCTIKLSSMQESFALIVS